MSEEREVVMRNVAKKPALLSPLDVRRLHWIGGIYQMIAMKYQEQAAILHPALLESDSFTLQN